MLHPFMPFVTEEIWHKMPGSEGFLMNQNFPEKKSDIPASFEEAGDEMNVLMDVITAVRNIRGEMNIPPGSPLKAAVQTDDAFIGTTIRKYREIVINLAKLKSFDVMPQGPKPENVAAAVIKGASTLVFLEGAADLSQEVKRLEKEIKKLENEITVQSKKLTNKNFLSKAPKNIVDKVRKKHKTLSEKRDKLQDSLQKAKALRQ